MKMAMDCVPCMMRQIVDAARRAKASEEVQRRILAGVCEILARELDTAQSAIVLCREMNRLVTAQTSVVDPYRTIKERHIKGALALYPYLKEGVARSEDRLLAALKVAAAGNILDIVINAEVQVQTDVQEILEQEFAICCLEEFRRQLAQSKNILILADNAGETVFDRILIEELGDKNIIYAVKDSPIINDATLTDARESGLEDVATLISAGCDTAGTVLDYCSEDFKRHFFAADIVLSKGMGNYEALSECSRPIYFLLKAKCQPVASNIGVGLGDLVFARQEDMGK